MLPNASGARVIDQNELHFIYKDAAHDLTKENEAFNETYRPY